MRALSHPLRFDVDGSLATVDEGSARHAGELAGIVASTVMGERSLAPSYGVHVGMDAAAVAAAVSRCEPELSVVDVRAVVDEFGRSLVAIDVEWTE